MSTQAISSTSIYQELQSFYQSRQSDVQSLGSALQSGNLSTAQQAYSQLVSLGQSGPFSGSDPFQRSDRAQDFEAIGQALSSGDLATAQASFAKLEQTFGQSSGQSTSSNGQDSQADSVNLSSSRSAANQISVTSGTPPSSSSSESLYQQLQSYRSERTTDLQQLGQALSSGDAKTAEQDYTNLVQLGQQGPFASGQPFQSSDRTQDFQAIGQALQSGNLTSAQQAFTQLENTFGKQSNPVQSGPGGSKYHTGTSESSGTAGAAATSISEIVINIGATPSSTPESTNGSELVINMPSPSSTGSPEGVQINFGGSNGSADQLTLQVGQTQGQNGSTGEQVTINLAQGSNNQNLVLNLFGEGSNSESQTQGSALNVQG
ncbi:MAG: hypothetical protein WAL71_18840 [Terriglobales bacterium]|jgi:hypothetical protein